MAIFVTGSTGYLGSYVVAGLLSGHRDKLNLLVRAKTEQGARERLWTYLQLHFDFPEFIEYMETRVRIFRGDLTNEQFGLREDEYHTLVDTTDSLIHCAASLNRKSEKQCLNVNLRGTLEVIQMARRAQDRHGFRRYSHVSTVAVAGKRKDEVVTEDNAIDWEPVASGRPEDHFPARHRAGRQPAAGDFAIRHGASGPLSSADARASAASSG